MTAPDRPGRTPGEWWARRSPGARIVVAVAALLMGVNVALTAVQGAWGNSPGGPASGASSTGGDGLAAYSDLLSENGHRVTHLRRTLRAGDLPAGSTAVVARVGALERGDVEALVQLLGGGGRVVIAGEGGSELIEALTGEAPTREQSDPVDRLAVWLPGPDTGTAVTLAGDGGARWRGTGPWAYLAGPAGEGGEDGATLVALDAGAGRILALSDVGPLRNDRLGQADDAALGLALAGPTGTAVAFVEGGGPTGATGLAAVPSHWRWVAGLGALALLIGLWAAGARFGPPEPDRRLLRPARVEHVEAVAAEMDRAASGPGRRSDPGLDTVLSQTDHPGVPE